MPRQTSLRQGAGWLWRTNQDSFPQDGQDKEEHSKKAKAASRAANAADLWTYQNTVVNGMPLACAVCCHCSGRDCIYYPDDFVCAVVPHIWFVFGGVEDDD